MNLARHYRTLGLRPGSSGSEIKAAYRHLVRQYHPDINPDKQAVEHFIKINDAYTAISATLQRAARKKPPRPDRAQHTPSPAQTTDTKPAATSRTRPQQPLNLDRLDVDSLKLQLEELGIGNFSHSQETTTSHSHGQTAFNQTAFNSGIPNEHSEPNAGTTDEQVPKHTSLSDVTDSDAPENAHDISLKQDAYSQLKKLLKHQKYPRAVALVEGLAHRMPTDAEISQWQAIVYQRWGRLLIEQGQHQKARIYLKKALRTDPNNPSLWSEVNRDLWHLTHLEDNFNFQSNFDAVRSQPKSVQ
ncbi:MAG: DnaJ domain-containing protein [Cyanobacteria bacterium P01_F01_bin.53]